MDTSKANFVHEISTSLLIVVRNVCPLLNVLENRADRMYNYIPFNGYNRGRECMAREPGVSLLMIASDSQIKFEFETLKAQYVSRKLSL